MYWIVADFDNFYLSKRDPIIFHRWIEGSLNIFGPLLDADSDNRLDIITDGDKFISESLREELFSVK